MFRLQFDYLFAGKILTDEDSASYLWWQKKIPQEEHHFNIFHDFSRFFMDVERVF